jgi:hypothetical protein
MPEVCRRSNPSLPGQKAVMFAIYQPPSARFRASAIAAARCSITSPYASMAASTAPVGIPNSHGSRWRFSTHQTVRWADCCPAAVA